MVDERFAYITDEDGKKYQVLKYETDEETGERIPVDWDEEETAKLIK
jgi:hypothetical protein